MFSLISALLREEKITLFAPLPLTHCRIVRPYLLERSQIKEGTAVIMAVPYYTIACDAPERNISAYAAARDYHRYFAGLFDRIIPRLKNADPTHHYAGFTDHSPIDEVHAAVDAGLGVLGDNHLLLTNPYSSYVFLGEIVTDSPLDYPIPSPAPEGCRHCGACRRACPQMRGETEYCLSALSQKKGVLTADEQEILRKHTLVWGCDICQEVCPYTIEAKRNGTIYSPIPWFSEEIITHLSTEQLDDMTDEAFEARAFSWRGRKTILRNLLLKEKNNND